MYVKVYVYIFFLLAGDGETPPKLAVELSTQRRREDRKWVTSKQMRRNRTEKMVEKKIERSILYIRFQDKLLCTLFQLVGEHLQPMKSEDVAESGKTDRFEYARRRRLHAGA
ncbi:hypothetical protein CRG98_011073 [Punica granatum]|uniref:Uncharacterized protein n=1 Tax=Punica granatum TaxID=22663 RepID=A0A2I0KJ30_PUNGR|nr:hypothetical protein CRG98_011073 [Punica granatum]